MEKIFRSPVQKTDLLMTRRFYCIWFLLQVIDIVKRTQPES